MLSAVSTPQASGTSGSTSPWMTRVGTRTAPSAALRLPDARIAAQLACDAGRVQPAREVPLGALEVARLVGGKLPAAQHLPGLRVALDVILEPSSPA